MEGEGDGAHQVTLRDGEVTYAFTQEDYERIRQQQQEEADTKPQWVTQNTGGEYVQVQVGTNGEVHPIQILAQQSLHLQGLQQLPDGQLIYTTIENPGGKLSAEDDIVVSAAPEDSNITQTIKPGIQVLDTHQLNTIIEEQEPIEPMHVEEPIEQKPLAAKQPDVVFKKHVFFDNLHDWYTTADYTDTIIRVRDGEKRAHSIVLGAASSLFRFMFAEISEKILDSEFLICFPDINLQELEENLLKPLYGLKPVEPEPVQQLTGTSLATISETSLLSTTITTTSADNTSNGKDSTQSLFGGLSAKLEVNSSESHGDSVNQSSVPDMVQSSVPEMVQSSVPEMVQSSGPDMVQPGGPDLVINREPQQPQTEPQQDAVILSRPPDSVHTHPYGFKLDFNEGGIYEALMRRQKDGENARMMNNRDSIAADEAEHLDYIIPPSQIKQERKKHRSKHGYNIEGFVESSDEDYKPVKNHSKHGYKYDGFVEDSTTDTSSDEDFDEDYDESKPRKRGRPKGSKNLGPGGTRKYQKRIKSEPLISVKEEAIDKSYDEFNDLVQKTQVTRNAEIKFAQDHIGFYHCQEDNCSFKTMVRPSVHQHHKFTHQNLHGYQEALLGCTFCGESWVNQIYYRKHVDSGECKAPNPVIPYVCENCGQGWYNLTNYTRHAEARECKTNTSHSGKKPCNHEGCPLTFFSDTNKETHQTRAHKPLAAGTMYRCAKCNINFVTHKEFNVHKKDVHGEKARGGFVTYVCKVPGCEYQQANRKQFVDHVKQTHPNECWICELCGRNFSDQYKLEQHKENNPNGRGGKRCLPVSYTCPHCPRDFNRKRHMELHVLFKHTQERPFGCDQCGKRFKTRHCVNVHLRTHGVGGYSWCCEECGKTFNQISAYHTHLKVHSNVRDFACEDCGMTFKLKHSLKKHQLVHKPEFGHTCDFCGKKFKRSDNLINHRRRHTGEHPYKCDKCNWTGPDSSSFIHHKKKHADQNQQTQEIKLIHAISKLPSHLLEQNRDPLGRDTITVSHASLI